MTYSTFRRAALAATAALAIAAPAAHAGGGSGAAVCNQASPHFQGGGLVAADLAVDSPAARYTDDLSPLPGSGNGLVGAASHSPALTICEDGGPTDV
jgi:hypothetical protein